MADSSAESAEPPLGLSALNQRIGRRSLIVMFTDFMDTITAELLMENIAALTRNHVVVFAVPKQTSRKGQCSEAPRRATPRGPRR